MPGFILLGSIFMSLIIIYCLFTGVKIDNFEALIFGCVLLTVIILLLSTMITSFPDISINTDYIKIRRLIFWNRLSWSNILYVKKVKTSFRRLPFPNNGEFLYVYYKYFCPAFFLITDSITGYKELSEILIHNFEKSSKYKKI